MGNQPSSQHSQPSPSPSPQPAGGRPIPGQPAGSATAARPAAAARPTSASSSAVNYTSTQANGTGTMTQAKKGTPVTLNVYEPAKGQSAMPGFGIFHTGIEISGVEYSFAGSPDAGNGTGIMTQQPRAVPPDGQWKFKEAIPLGETKIAYHELDKVLQELRDAFPANTYDLVHRNCNHFTTAAAKRLGVHGPYPSWINRAATWGAVFTAAPKNHKPIDLAPKESVFKTSTGYRMDGTTVVPKGAKAPAAKSDKEEKKKESGGKEEKKSQGGAGKARKNPWADPNFVPPGMRDSVVNGFAPAVATEGPTAAK